MSTKDHYDNHLASIYSWMTGDFATAQATQQTFLSTNGIIPNTSKVAIDLGAGHGLQAISLAKLGFEVYAVDFNHQLLEELRVKAIDYSVSIVEDEILNFLANTTLAPSLVTCMGDTLTHLESLEQVETFIQLVQRRLIAGGKLALSFRDLTQELSGVQRFIPVKNDESKILTCFLEYLPDRVMVHDIIHEKVNETWQQKVSAYAKLRLSESMMETLLEKNGFEIISAQTINRMIYMVARK
jgi:SAM-dependent methyltransferase